MAFKNKPAVLIILDGFGITSPSSANAIWTAKTPFFDKMVKYSPTMLLEASGINVGLPMGEVGNSEVGHINIGSGTLIYQSLPRIDKEIESGEFFKHSTLLEVAEKLKSEGGKLHLMGLAGNGGIHAHSSHLRALLDFCKQKNLKDVCLHLFLDGRDAGKDTGKDFVKDIMGWLKDLKIGKIASISGRFYAMDRNNNWDRTQLAYKAIASGQGEAKFDDPVRAIEESYKKGVYDEEFKPVTITDKKGEAVTINANDTVIFFNFRSDRARQLTKAFVDQDFKKFERPFLQGLKFITMTEYEKGLPVKILYPPIIIKNPLAKIISENGLTQLHVAETEKYAHVTFFINGLQEEKFKGEDRILIPSPSVASYDETPEMSSAQVTDEVVKAIKAGKHDFIIVNYANPDMVGHTGNLDATIKAITCVDSCIEKVITACVNQGGTAFVVADHGNAEELIKLNTNKMDKEHSIYPVPFIIVNKNLIGKVLAEAQNGDLSLFSTTGLLSDVTPTILGTLGLGVAPEMTGNNLLENIKF